LCLSDGVSFPPLTISFCSWPLRMTSATNLFSYSMRSLKRKRMFWSRSWKGKMNRSLSRHYSRSGRSQ
jgi:hypothetical protein